jgi:hypothetical protein
MALIVVVRYLFNMSHQLCVCVCVARYVVETEKDMKKATELLSECSLLKIEDILPFFPDFITIDDFKVRQLVF